MQQNQPVNQLQFNNHNQIQQIDPNIQIQYDEYQKHMQIINNQTKQILQQQQSLMNNPQIALNQIHTYNQQHSHVSSDFNSLPPPPLQLLEDPQNINQNMNSYELYAESSVHGNARQNKLAIQQASLTTTNNNNRQSVTSNHERPHLPPPPIPNENNQHQFSDLTTHIQQQLTRKFDANLNLNSNLTATTAPHDSELPPPPSPPNFTELNYNQAIKSTTSVSMQQATIQEKVVMNGGAHIDMIDSFMGADLPPPPPSLDILHDLSSVPISLSPQMRKFNRQPSVPQQPPPPIPSLSVYDHVNNSNILSSSPSNLNEQHHDESKNVGNAANISSVSSASATVNTSGRSFLDDINKGRFTLKPTQRLEHLEERKRINSFDESGSNNNNSSNRDTLQPLVNNSDVAAIIDFVRKFRPHVEDSSDDDENSDWDD